MLYRPQQCCKFASRWPRRHHVLADVSSDACNCSLSQVLCFLPVQLLTGQVCLEQATRAAGTESHMILCSSCCSHPHNQPQLLWMAADLELVVSKALQEALWGPELLRRPPLLEVCDDHRDSGALKALNKFRLRHLLQQ